MRRFALCVALGLAMVTGGLAFGATPSPEKPRVDIITSDVDRFYALYDDPAIAAKPDVLAARYLAGASPGLKEFMVLRRITPEKLAKALREKPKLFADARRCAAKLGNVRTRLVAATGRLAALYPFAKFPPITIAIGRGTTAGTANAKGLYIGLESLCMAKFIEADDEDRFVHVIAHEYAHVQQPLAQIDDDNATVLKASLVEGAAEFIAEQMTGSVAYPLLHQWADPRAKMLGEAFVAEKDQKAMGSRWLYNQRGDGKWPGDLGYWAGYQIVKSFYDRAPDKKVAIRQIIEMRDPAVFLARSGWTPGS